MKNVQLQIVALHVVPRQRRLYIRFNCWRQIRRQSLDFAILRIIVQLLRIIRIIRRRCHSSGRRVRILIRQLAHVVQRVFHEFCHNCGLGRSVLVANASIMFRQHNQLNAFVEVAIQCAVRIAVEDRCSRGRMQLFIRAYSAARAARATAYFNIGGCFDCILRASTCVNCQKTQNN